MQNLGDRSGLGAPVTQYVGVPMNQQMDRFGEATLIQQEFDLIEIFGVEAKQVWGLGFGFGFGVCVRVGFGVGLGLGVRVRVKG
jgi:hypothetical protein